MSSTIPLTQETIEQQVMRLLKTWRLETAYLSSSTQRHAHPAYQEIIQLGASALPSLFRDLEQTRDGHLSKALTMITGAHPIPVEARGKIEQIADLWLAWAQNNGLRD
jgi:hypothetical protein